MQKRLQNTDLHRLCAFGKDTGQAHSAKTTVSGSLPRASRSASCRASPLCSGNHPPCAAWGVHLTVYRNVQHGSGGALQARTGLDVCYVVPTSASERTEARKQRCLRASGAHASRSFYRADVRSRNARHTCHSTRLPTRRTPSPGTSTFTPPSRLRQERVVNIKLFPPQSERTEWG